MASFMTKVSGWFRNVLGLRNSRVAEKQEEMNLVLIGKAGSGKSSVGNMLLGTEKFKVSSGFNSCTHRHERSSFKTSDGRSIQVADTPGIYNERLSADDVKAEIVAAVKECDPHAFLLTIPFNTRFTEELQKAVELLECWLEPKVWDSTVVVFTHAEELMEKSIDEFVGDSAFLRNFARKVSGRFVMFSKKQTHKRDKFVSALIHKVQPVASKPYTYSEHSICIEVEPIVSDGSYKHK